jgi:formylglycine-generating enzyme required for sulfatase activity
MNFDVFISYPHQDKATADAACAKLEAEGIRCWIAPRDVPPGAEWAEAIVDAIDSCRAMVLIFSSNTNASRQIRREVQQAFDGEKPVVPFRIEDVVPERSLRYYMDSVHWLDALTPPLEQHLEKLAASVQALVRRATDGDVDKDRTLRDAEVREQRLRNEADAHKREAEGHDREGAVAAAEHQRQEGNAAAAREAKENERKEKEAEPQGAKARRLRNEIEASNRVEEEARRSLPRSQARPQWSPARPTVIAASLIGLAVLGAVGVWLIFVGPTSVPAPALAPVVQAPVRAPAPAPVAPVPVPVTPTKATDTPLSPATERALKPKDMFKECTNCPEIIVVPAGRFTMGSPANEQGHSSDESPQHTVTFARQFAVGQFGLTFDEWDACVAGGGCNGYKPFDEGLGHGRRPVINVSWDDARAYIVWLSNKTGKTYRLLSEAEYEYATRAGTTTMFPWGNDIGTNNANCNGCGSQWDGKQTAPVGSFSANSFGLYDMVGNVNGWTEDCYHDSYKDAPADGLAWTSSGCSMRVFRGGSWYGFPARVRSASRNWAASDNRDFRPLGFRVGRTLTP